MEIPLTDTMKTVIGLIGVITLGIGVLSFVILCQKVFGRKPSISKEMKALRTEIYHTTGAVKKELKELIAAQNKEISDLRELHMEIQIDRKRELKELKDDINELGKTLAFIRGKFEKGATT